MGKKAVAWNQGPAKPLPSPGHGPGPHGMQQIANKDNKYEKSVFLANFDFWVFRVLENSMEIANNDNKYEKSLFLANFEFWVFRVLQNGMGWIRIGFAVLIAS